MSKKVYVGLSGGVDSSVAAALLQKQGYRVTGVYMKNWSQDIGGYHCPWREDYLDAKRVAVHLGIDFKLYDFEKEYRTKVVDYMTREYQAGRTPNPDVMCNQEVKFKLFLDVARSEGAELIATGHYARIEKSNKTSQLLTARDQNKDQTYFLYRLSQKALSQSLMPIGDLTKPEVRQLAHRFGLVTATKKDSQGICFVGEVGIKDFLISELGDQSPGPIIDQHGRVVGEHDGAIFYTIGQRHGLSVGGGLPYYVTSKNMVKNIVYVTTDLNDTKLWYKQIKLANTHWINEPPGANLKLKIRTRYRAPLVPVKGLKITKDSCHIELAEEVRAVTAGQSAVIYDGDRVVGGGIVI